MRSGSGGIFCASKGLIFRAIFGDDQVVDRHFPGFQMRCESKAVFQQRLAAGLISASGTPSGAVPARSKRSDSIHDGAVTC